MAMSDAAAASSKGKLDATETDLMGPVVFGMIVMKPLDCDCCDCRCCDYGCGCGCDYNYGSDCDCDCDYDCDCGFGCDFLWYDSVKKETVIDCGCCCCGGGCCCCCCCCQTVRHAAGWRPATRTLTSMVVGRSGSESGSGSGSGSDCVRTVKQPPLAHETASESDAEPDTEPLAVRNPDNTQQPPHEMETTSATHRTEKTPKANYNRSLM